MPNPEIKLELDPEEEGVCWLLWNGEQIGALAVDESGTGLRLVLGNMDPGGGLKWVWHGDPISVRLDLSEGIAHMLGGQH